jgi:hypothetical protein
MMLQRRIAVATSSSQQQFRFFAVMVDGRF